MFCKLAWKNVSRSLRDYGVYFLTLTFGVCLFYVFNSLESQWCMQMLSRSTHYMAESILVLMDVFSAFVSVVLAGLVCVLMLMVQEISDLFDLIQTLFDF